MAHRTYPKLADAQAFDPEPVSTRAARGSGVDARPVARRAWRVWVVEEPAPARHPGDRLGIHGREAPRRRGLACNTGSGLFGLETSIQRRVEQRPTQRDAGRGAARHLRQTRARSGVVELHPEEPQVAAPQPDLGALEERGPTSAALARHNIRRRRSCRAIGGTRLSREHGSVCRAQPSRPTLGKHRQPSPRQTLAAHALPQRALPQRGTPRRRVAVQSLRMIASGRGRR